MNKKIFEPNIFVWSQLPDTDALPRILYSEGTVRASKLTNQTKYGPQSWLPKNNWGVPNREDLQKIKTPQFLGSHNTVGIVRVPKTIINQFQKSGIGSVRSSHEMGQITKTEAFQKGQDQFVRYLRQTNLRDSKTLILHQPTLNVPGAPTTTFDQQNNRYLGLHLDSWDSIPYERRAESSNRISINLGSQNRYFLFLYLGFSSILEAIPENERQSHSTGIIESFLSRYPHLPVVKVRISPGEAYIAPTENIIHDGEAGSLEQIDIHLTARGHYFPMVQTSVFKRLINRI